MGKRRSALDGAQLGFEFGVPEAASSDGALDDLHRVSAAVVSRILKDDGRSRYEIAGAVSALLGEDVSKLMLDAYASEARDGHRISFDRMLALIAATQRYDLLRLALHRIGADLLVGEEVFLAEIGHLESERRQIDARLKMLKAEATPMKPGGSRR